MQLDGHNEPSYGGGATSHLPLVLHRNRGRCTPKYLGLHDRFTNEIKLVTTPAGAVYGTVAQGTVR